MNLLLTRIHLENYEDRLKYLKASGPSIGVTKKVSLTLDPSDWNGLKNNRRGIVLVWNKV